MRRRCGLREAYRIRRGGHPDVPDFLGFRLEHPGSRERPWLAIESVISCSIASKYPAPKHTGVRRNHEEPRPDSSGLCCFMLCMGRFAAPCSHSHPFRWGLLGRLNCTLFSDASSNFLDDLLFRRAWSENDGRGSGAFVGWKHRPCRKCWSYDDVLYCH